MSVSATTAAKKRRANNGTNPMFKSPSSSEMNSQNNDSISTPASEKSTANNIQRPMTLQQVITVFDNRLLTLEKSLLNNKNTNEQSSDTNTTTTTVKSDIDREYIEKVHQDFHDSLHEHVSEFDHRYQLLAKEVVELKHIVLKLQSYTLDVNKALIEERVQILTTDGDNNETLQIQPDDILDLHSDLQSMEKGMTADDDVSLESVILENEENKIQLDMEESEKENKVENIQKETIESETDVSNNKDETTDLVENVVSTVE